MKDVQVYPEKGLVICKVTTITGEVYEGKAKCSPSDKFDVETGTRLAYLRALLAVGKHNKKVLKREVVSLKSELKDYETYLRHVKRNVKNIERSIERIAGWED